MTLRIQKSVEAESVVYTLAGRIQGEQLPDLQALLKAGSVARSVVLDLGCVKLVDREAVQFLALSEAAGIRLRNCAAYIREWIARERKATQGDGADSARGWRVGEEKEVSGSIAKPS